MKSKYFKQAKIIYLAITSLFLFIVLNASFVAFAYFSAEIQSQSKSTLDVRLIFGFLDSSLNPTGPWGSETNPYLIAEEQHLRNLYTLQNRADRTIINDDSVFQVSDRFGKPNFIGGESATSLYPIPSIGNERYPFTSTLRGVKTTNPAEYVTLPTGEKSDTSVFGNIKVEATSNQIDIGLFGNVGPTTAPAPGEVIGELSTLLLYNVQVSSNAIGNYEGGHTYFVSGGTYETNHIGILVGHAQYSSINNISVYYSGPMESQNQKDVKAFDLALGTTAKYTTASGIVGHYTNIIVNDDTALPVSSTGFPDQIGGSNTGLGLGVVYSEDIWTFMEDNVFNGATAPNDEYNLQETFGAELYGTNNPNKKYFSIGVFTFAHSKQTKGKDRLSKLWTEPNSNEFKISTSNNYGTTSQYQKPAIKYKATQITSSMMSATSFVSNRRTYYYHQLNPSTYGNTTNYRYVFTVGTAGNEYALMRYGTTTLLKKVDMTNFIIPSEDLENYGFTPLASRTKDVTYPPYSPDSSYRYHTSRNLLFVKQTYTHAQFAAYGKLSTDGTGKILEAPRPLRIFWLSGQTPSITFNASSSTGIEGIKINPIKSGALTNNPTNDNYSTFQLQRTSDAGGTNRDSYMTYSPTLGLSASDSISNAATVKMYAIRITTNPGTPSESPVATDYNKTIRTPSTNIKTYDMMYTTLKYTGTPNSTNLTLKYKYDIQSIESLNWSDNKGKALTKVEKTLKMGAPTSYYYIDDATFKFWGVTEGIPSPIAANETINVPEGSIGFTVNGTGQSNTLSSVYVIVSTDPKQDINQEITISRFGSGANQDGDRSIIESFVLPPVPATLSAETYPIIINDNGTNYTAYPNLNTLLVAYEFKVPSMYTTTYFLEASQGSGSFVYLSAERSAATDNNPTHENDVFFPHLSGVDFVFRSPTTPINIATVGSADYTSSLTALYFGIKANPSNPQGENPALDAVIIPITNGFDFTYSVGRIYNDTEKKYFLYVNIVIPSYQTNITKTQLIQIMNNMNFNFSEWSYLDSENYQYAFSDVLVMTVNNYTITNWAQDLTP